MTSGLYIYVDDVDVHCEHARAAGATIVKEPEDMFYGDRQYTANTPPRTPRATTGSSANTSATSTDEECLQAMKQTSIGA